MLSLPFEVFTMPRAGMLVSICSFLVSLSNFSLLKNAPVFWITEFLFLFTPRPENSYFYSHRGQAELRAY